VGKSKYLYALSKMYFYASEEPRPFGLPNQICGTLGHNYAKPIKPGLSWENQDEWGLFP
jgi:hypothetical protein